MLPADTVSNIDNPVGFEEDYTVYRSTNPVGESGSPYGLTLQIVSG